MNFTDHINALLGTSPGPVCGWRMNDTSGNFVDMVSGSNRPLAASGTITRNVTGPFGAGTGTGAARFSNVNYQTPGYAGWGDANRGFGSASSGISVSIWVRGIANAGGAFTIGGPSGAPFMAPWITGNDGGVGWGDGNNYLTATLKPLLNDGRWHHYVFTVTGARSLTGYCDGIQIGTASMSAGPFTGTYSYASAWVIDWQQAVGGHEFGPIAVWPRALSAQEVATLYVGPKITTTSLPQIYRQSAYSVTMQASGTAPYTWALTTAVPANTNLTLGASTGILSGTPSSSMTAGTSAIGFRVTDATNLVGTASLNLTRLATSAPTAPTISTTPPPAGTVGIAYSFQLSASGGVTPYTWSISAGQLPAGLTLSSGGLISGTPTTQTGGTSFTVQASSDTSPVLSATRQFTLVVNAGAPVGPLRISPVTFPGGTVTRTYNVTVTAEGGVPFPPI